MAYKLNYKTGTVAHSPNMNIYFSNISFSNHNNFVQDFFTVKSCVKFSEQIYVRVAMGLCSAAPPGLDPCYPLKTIGTAWRQSPETVLLGDKGNPGRQNCIF